MSESTDRPLRSDARENQDRLLRAAARRFARDGTQASLKAIAQDAGVGIATLYRRFPTREQLVEATYRSEVERVAASAETLLETAPPLDALRDWMRGFIDLLAAKYGMADTLKAALAEHGGLRTDIRQSLTDALQRLLDACAKAGAVRADVEAFDVLLGLGGIALIAGAPDQAPQAQKLIDLLIDGLRYTAG
jgi:AcrR family transcriptional regulator